MARIGLPGPRAVCVTCSAYRRYLLETGLDDRTALLLGRKEFSQMRWEELWDLSLRIRSLFLKTPVPPPVFHYGEPKSRWPISK